MSEQTKTEIMVDPELAANYARVKNVSIEEATERLRANFAKEANVDVGQRLIALRNGFAKLQPQVQGLVLRESDTNHAISRLVGDIKVINERLTFEREIYAQSMKILNDIVKHDAQVMARISKLEELRVPLYKRILNRIKCFLNN
jgi:hypothetical protein